MSNKENVVTSVMHIADEKPPSVETGWSDHPIITFNNQRDMDVWKRLPLSDAQKHQVYQKLRVQTDYDPNSEAERAARTEAFNEQVAAVFDEVEQDSVSTLPEPTLSQLTQDPVSPPSLPSSMADTDTDYKTPASTSQPPSRVATPEPVPRSATPPTPDLDPIPADLIPPATCLTREYTMGEGGLSWAERVGKHECPYQYGR